jgi:hypothetical protein
LPIAIEGRENAGVITSARLRTPLDLKHDPDKACPGF